MNVERIIKLFLGLIVLVIFIAHPDFVVSALQSFVDCAVRTADAISNLNLHSATTGKG